MAVDYFLLNIEANLPSETLLTTSPGSNNFPFIQTNIPLSMSSSLDKVKPRLMGN